MARLLVYRDNDYDSGWINYWVTERIVDYLNNKGFRVVDAQELRDCMTTMIDRKEAFDSVVVFAQDLIPDTVIETPRPDALVRSYLNAGGRIIWIGDVPFYWQGLPNKEKRMWGAEAQNSVLDIAVRQIIGLEPLSVTIKPEGKKRGLQISWAGNRPVEDSKNTLTAKLATSIYQGRTVIHAWFKNFNKNVPESGFVRIWDYIPHDISDRLLNELYAISIYAISL
jgi:hypothetical protein